MMTEMPGVRLESGVSIGVDYLSVAPVPGYEPGTGAGLANVPFYDPDPWNPHRVPSRARRRGVLDPEDGGGSAFGATYVTWTIARGSQTHAAAWYS
jgi:hypothetical protein